MNSGLIWKASVRTSFEQRQVLDQFFLLRFIEVRECAILMPVAHPAKSKPATPESCRLNNFINYKDAGGDQ
jgi:hypothetical protein